MSSQPPNSFKQPGGNGATPQGPSYLHLPYIHWPQDRRPRVRCGGCDQLMEPTANPEYPHEFRCPGECEGYVDVVPPQRVAIPKPDPVSWPPPKKQCGVYVHSVRCGKSMPASSMCCIECEERIVTGMWEALGNPAGGMYRKRQFILNMVGDYVIEQERTKRQEAERARRTAAAEAQRLARQDTSHHVVYYARLGHNHIKIGTTGDLPRRMAELRVVNAGNLLAAEPGGPDMEKQRHQQFRKWRYSVRKEDFAEGPDLLTHIERTRIVHGDPYTLAAELAQSVA